MFEPHYNILGWDISKCKEVPLALVDNAISEWVSLGGEVYTEIIRGGLHYGITILTGLKDYKSVIFCEYHVNTWTSSTHYKLYTQLPKRFLEFIQSYKDERVLDMDDDERIKWENAWLKKLKSTKKGKRK